MRKRQILSLLLTTVLFAILTGPALYAADIRIMVNGQEINYGDSPPLVINDRTMVGVRYLAIALGVPESGILWNESSQTVTLTKGDKVVTLTLGSNNMAVNDDIVTMDTVPAVHNDRVYLPVRYVAEAFGFSVSWNESTQTADLTGDLAPLTPGDSENTDGQRTWSLDVSGTIQTSPFGTIRDNILKIKASKQGGDNMLGTYTGTIYYKQDYKLEGMGGYSYIEYSNQPFTIELVAYDADTYTNYGIDNNALAPLAPSRNYAAMGYMETVLNGHSSINTWPLDDPSNVIINEADQSDSVKIRMAVYGNETTIDFILPYDNVSPFLGTLSD